MRGERINASVTTTLNKTTHVAFGTICFIYQDFGSLNMCAAWTVDFATSYYIRESRNLLIRGRKWLANICITIGFYNP